MVWRSSTLRDHAGVEHFARFRCLGDALAHTLGQQLTEPCITLTAMRTWSPATHVTDDCFKVAALAHCHVHPILRLGAYGSEEELRSELTILFKAQTVMTSALLLIQSDGSADPHLIRQVRLLCQQLRWERMHWPKAEIESGSAFRQAVTDYLVTHPSYDAGFCFWPILLHTQPLLD